MRDGALCCAQCLAASISKDDAGALSEEALAALVAEFIQLHAEAKQLNERLDAVKEQLKRHAASQPRVANAVLLRTGEHAVKCGYSIKVTYNADKLATVEALLGTEQFTALFTRKMTFSAVKESLEAFLARGPRHGRGACRHSGCSGAHRDCLGDTRHAEAQDRDVSHTIGPFSRQATPMTPSPSLSPRTPPVSDTPGPVCDGARAMRTLFAPGAVPVRRRGADAPLRRQAGSALPPGRSRQRLRTRRRRTTRCRGHRDRPAPPERTGVHRPIRSQPLGRALYYQATLTGRIGAVDCEGIADVLDVVRCEIRRWTSPSSISRPAAAPPSASVSRWRFMPGC